MTRPGIEGGRNATKRRSVTVGPTNGGALERSAVTLGCNECNEALDAARAAMSAARRLALVVENALDNGDLQRVRTALRNLHDAMMDGADAPAPDQLSRIQDGAFLAHPGPARRHERG